MEDNLKSKAIDIKGKKYVLVSDRILYFNSTYPDGSITTQLVSDPNADLVVFKATIRPTAQREFSAYSQATWDDGYINKTAALENAETSAVGRALAFMGIGVLESIASADEVNKATSQKPKVPNPPNKFHKNFVPPDNGITDKDLPAEMFKESNPEPAQKLPEDLAALSDEMDKFVPLPEEKHNTIQDRLKELVSNKSVNRRNLSLFLEKRHGGKKSFDVSADVWDKTMADIEKAVLEGTDAIKALMKG